MSIAQLPQPGDAFGRYRIDRVIGQGGMGIVYGATDSRLGRQVAIKVITGALAHNSEFVTRFHDEATTLSRLDSPYVIDILDHDELDGLPYIVTQYVEGSDLGSLVTERGTLTAREALGICAQVARGLADAHRAGVIHRDVKPANVLLRNPGTPDVHAYVIDFGIARSDENQGRTATGMVAGTWAYLSPERTQGAPASPASDLYALGCVLWTCLTGREPYTGTEVEMAIAHAQAPVPQLAGDDPFAAELNPLLARLLAKDPRIRWGSADAVADELARLASVAPDRPVARPAPTTPRTVQRGSGPSFPPPPPPPPPASPASPTVLSTSTRERRRRWLVPVAGSVAVLLIAALATWALVLRDDGDEPDDGPASTPEAVRGDLDGDGLGDAFEIRYDRDTGGVTAFTYASTSRSFGAPEGTAADPGWPHVAEADGDGVLDVLWIQPPDSSAGRPLQVRARYGDGEVRDIDVEVDDSLLDGSIPTVLLADVDGDGRDDLVIAGDGSEGRNVIQVSLAVDTGFAEVEPWTIEGSGSFSLTHAGDVDGDGADELVSLAATDPTDYESQQEIRMLDPVDGTFRASVASPVAEAVYGSEMLVGDIDGDGTDEVVLPEGDHGQVSVTRFDGEAFSVPEEVRAGTIPDRSWNEWMRVYGYIPDQFYGLSDVDGDGDDDLLIHTLRRKEVAITVSLFEDGEVGDAEEWAREDCNDEGCDDGSELIPT